MISNYDEYLKWLAGADHSLTKEDLADIKGLIYSQEADEIHKAASTELGATP